MTSERHVVGVISDTHGLVRPDVHRALEGVALILHAGDVCGDEIFDELALIAPLYAVRGNCDPLDDPRLPSRLERTIGGVSIHVSHGHEFGVPTADKLLAAYDAGVIVFGHTHRPLIVRAGDRLVLNPGAAGPRRFNLTPTVARLTIADGAVDVELIDLI